MKYTVLGCDQSGPYTCGMFGSLREAEEYVSSRYDPDDYEIKITKDVGFIW